MLFIGLIPGPSNPKDTDSFLWPLAEEMLSLGRGVGFWNAANGLSFTLRTYITVVIADMPGRGKLMNMKGSGHVCTAHTAYAEGYGMVQYTDVLTDLEG